MSLPWRRFQLYFADLMPEEIQNMPTAEEIRAFDNVLPFSSAEPAKAEPFQVEESSAWWEGPLDQVLGRKIDGTTTFVDSTKLDLSSANALAGKLR